MRRARAGSATTGIGYTRVSTDDQRIGVEAQREAIEAYAKREGIVIVEWHTDHGVSGATSIEERPGYCAAIAAARTHRAGVIVVAKRDRIARDVAVAAMAERAAGLAGARLVSADGAANATGVEGMMLRGMFDVFAAVEREMIRSRTRAALQAKKARGERVGMCPFGWSVGEDGVHLEMNAAEQSVIGTVRELADAGLSMRRIAEDLAGRGVVGRTGKPLNHSQVHKLVVRTA